MDPGSDFVTPKGVYATLTPANALARLALSDTYDALTAGRQNTPRDDGPVCRIQVMPTQTCDDAVSRLKRELERKLQCGDGFTSDSLTEPFSGGEMAASTRELGMIWTGRYLVGFQPLPSAPELGWTAGKGRLPGSSGADLLLCTAAFAKKHGINLRAMHARFSFDPQNRALFIAGKSSSQHAELAVNGTMVGGQLFALNQHSMNIDLDKLRYVFEYTDWAATPDFEIIRENYLTESLGAPLAVDFEMPTPLRNVRTVGQWTLSGPLGRGGMGRVFLASNSKNEVVAVKIVERNARTKDSVDREVQAFQKLTALAKEWDARERIVRLIEVIGHPGAGNPPSSQTPFQEVAIVMAPMTPLTLSSLVENSSDGGSRGMTIGAARAFRDALLGVKDLHGEGWLHGDLKPPNIGVIGTPPRAVLLDIGHATHLGPNSTLRPTPGDGGTLGYIAPEREMERYNHSVDVWSLGVIGFELTYGRHPWRFARNPWRGDRKDCEGLRRDFNQRYEEVIDMLTRDARAAAEPSQQHIQLGHLLTQMLKHPYARVNHGRRISINEALQHEAWGPLLSDVPRKPKRPRQDDGVTGKADSQSS